MTDRAHFSLAKTCITYLSARTFAPYRQSSLELLELIKSHPFIEYAVQFWHFHAFDFGNDDSTLQKASSFISNSEFSGQFRLYMILAYMVFAGYQTDITGNGLIWELEDDIKRGLTSVQISQIQKYEMTTPLQRAAILGSPSLCKQYIQLEGSYNLATEVGGPLHYALLGFSIFDPDALNCPPVYIDHIQEIKIGPK